MAGTLAGLIGTGKLFATLGAGKAASDNCCCTYEASDGTDQSDNFNTPSGPPISGWSDDGSGEWKAASGKCRWQQNIASGSLGWIYKTFTVAQEDGLEIIAEVDVARLNSDTNELGLEIYLDWDETVSPPANSISVRADYQNTRYEVDMDGSAVTLISPPSPGADKITIHLREHDTGLFVFCVFVDEVLIAHACADWNGAWTPTGPNVNAVRLRMSANPPPTIDEDRGEFDNYLLEINDP